MLSLVVQAVQDAIKKLLKIKSRQLEESLVDLFENVLAQPNAEKPLTSLEFKAGMPTGGTVTAKVPGHGFVSGQRKTITGAEPSEYNGTFTIQVTDADTFTYPLWATPGAPAATTAGRVRAAMDRVRSPILQIFTKHPSDKTAPEVKQLFDAVLAQFRKLVASRRLAGGCSTLSRKPT